MTPITIVSVVIAFIVMQSMADNFVQYPKQSHKQESEEISLKAKATCNFMQMATPLFVFFSNFGFNDTYQPTSASDFSTVLYAYIDNPNVGVAGWDDVRDWLLALIDSAGAANFNACIQWDQWMINTNQTVGQSKNWQIQFMQLQYNLGPAYTLFTHNWYCIDGVVCHQNPAIQQCIQQYDNNENTQPENHCENLVTFLNCYVRPFTTGCGAAAGGVVCYNELIYYQVYDAACAAQVQLRCRGAPPPKF
jgi:hypothetical protein